MRNVESLKALYAALGGTPSDVANASTIVDVLNAIAALYEGDSDATLNAEAIANITAVLDNIIPEPTQSVVQLTSTDLASTSEVYIYNSDDKTYIFGYATVSSGGKSKVVFTYPEDFIPVSTTKKSAFWTQISNDNYVYATPVFDTTNRTISTNFSSMLTGGQSFAVCMVMGD